MTHSRKFADLVRDRIGSRALTVMCREWETFIEGMCPIGLMPDDDG